MDHDERDDEPVDGSCSVFVLARRHTLYAGSSSGHTGSSEDHVITWLSEN